MKILFTIITILSFSLTKIHAQTTQLLGLTSGVNDGGVFSINEDGIGPIQLVNFDGTNGKDPTGSLIESNGKLWGLTAGGGTNSSGVIFTLDLDGTNFQKVHDFDGTNGQFPVDNLVESNGKLWGLTPSGGLNGDGVIFTIDFDGSNFTNVHDFEVASGRIPRGSLVESNGKLWGTTVSGGSKLTGIIFSIDLDGANFTNVRDFDFTDQKGHSPEGSLLENDGKLYGTTREGGINGLGAIFSLDSDGSNYTAIHDFDDINGMSPYCDLIENDGKLWGTTQQGGTSGKGVIFSLDLPTGTFSKVHDFDDTNGANPRGGLVLVNDQFWGMTQFGGANANGVIYTLNLDGSNFQDIYDLDPATIDGRANGILIAIKQKGEQLLEFVLEDQQLGDDPFTLLATSNTANPIVYISSDEGIISISGDLATINNVGQVTITASQAENEDYLAASISQTINVTLVTATNPFEAPNDTFVAYPNPTTGQFKLSQNSQDYQISIYNPQGVLVKRFIGYQDTYNIEELSNGLYTVLLKSKETVATSRLLKK